MHGLESRPVSEHQDVRGSAIELHETWLEQQEDNSKLMLTLYLNVSMKACY